ncbi:MAG TPA: hypothetical protein VN368_00095 [Candidatus Methylomirabilis sp.]|nr:hypothetical protein [Candidatus Methylomirabilis sp.]
MEQNTVNENASNATEQHSETKLVKVIPNFVGSSDAIILQAYVLNLDKIIRFDGIIAYDENGKVVNPFIAGMWIKKIPSPEKAWDSLKTTLEHLNESRQKSKPPLPKFEIYDEGNTILTLNNNLSSKAAEIKFQKEQKEKAKENKESYQDPQSSYNCPKCNGVCDKIEVEGNSAWKCPGCGNEYPIDSVNGYPILDRNQDYRGYITETKDGVEDITNFNVIFSRILEIDENERIVDGKFHHIDSKTGKPSEIKFETEERALHIQKDFNELMIRYSGMLEFKHRKVPEILDEINKDKARQHIVTVKKTQNFGWNADYNSYLTPQYDYELDVSADGVCEKVNDQFLLKDQIREYCIKHNIDWEHPEGHEAPVKEGSVKILNSTIQNKIKLGFKDCPNVKETLAHIKTTLMSLSPKMDRTIPVVFLSPLTSILNELGLSYQLYMDGKSGIGKSQIALMYMSFFSEINNDKDFVDASSSVNAIEEIGYYHRDTIFVVDNYKETQLDESSRQKIMLLMGRIADRHRKDRMAGSDYESFYVRGCTFQTGEERLSDASVVRKWDIIDMIDGTDNINIDILRQCHEYRKDYSGVMADYVKWLLKTYGNGLKDELENRKKRQEKNFQNPLFVANMMGYELFIQFLLYWGVINGEEYSTMYKNHLEVLKIDEAEKLEKVNNETSWGLYQKAIAAMLTTEKAKLKNDSEYNKGFITIGETNREMTEILIYKEAYSEIRNYTKGKLPENPETVYDMAPSYVATKKLVRSARNEGKADRKNIVFPRDLLVPHSKITGMPLLADLSTEVAGYIQHKAKIEKPPTTKEYNEIMTHMLKMLPSTKKDAKEEFLKDVKVLINTYFIGKFGTDWQVPT